MLVQISFVALLLVVIVIGFYCAGKFNSSYPLFIRLITLFPAITAMLTLYAMASGNYAPYPMDVVKSVDCVLLYALIASRFTCNPWLDLRVGKDGKICRKQTKSNCHSLMEILKSTRY